MSYVRTWVHFVWAVKNREPVLVSPYREKLLVHMRKNAKEKKIYLNRINGYHDHVHCLVSLGGSQTIVGVARLMKGESSFWFNNKSGFQTRKLQWQDEFFAVSICESNLAKVQTYIDGQEGHHQKRTFEEEYAEFIRKYKF